MSGEFDVQSYSGFDAGVSTAQDYSDKIVNAQQTLDTAKQIISEQTVFMGPIQEDCIQEFEGLNNNILSLQTDITTISSYLDTVNNAYKTGDAQAQSIILGTSQGSLSTGTGIVSSVSFKSSRIYRNLLRRRWLVLRRRFYSDSSSKWNQSKICS